MLTAMPGRRSDLAERRRAVGLTQEELAELLYIDRTTVVRWEGGKCLPQPYIRPKLARTLGISLDGLDQLLVATHPVRTKISERAEFPEFAAKGAFDGAMIPAFLNGRCVLIPLAAAHAVDERIVRPPDDESRDYLATASVEWGHMSPLSRRSLLSRSLTAAMMPALDESELDRVLTAANNAYRYLDGTVIDSFRKQISVCMSEEGGYDSRKTLPTVLAVLRMITEHARAVQSRRRHELLRVGSIGAEFAGWLYRDSGDMCSALFWHDRAIEWAQESDDLPMQGYVLLKKAQLAYDERETARMFALSDAACNRRWLLPSRVRAEAVQQQARAQAMMGDPISEIERKLGHAQTLLARSTTTAQGGTLGPHYTENIFNMQLAACYAEAGQPARAVELYQNSLTEQDFSSRDYGFFLSWMATSLALAGEPDQAALIGIDSASRANTADSERTRKELRRVLDKLSNWQDRDAVKQLRTMVSV